ncbi:hypothetical protein CHH80_22875 [Bacillus sp. 7504-2]|nr:hypothetical protein CHH80_22875 [Bacillus sp. 7504-2]
MVKSFLIWELFIFLEIGGRMIKLAAISLMVVDHIGFIFFPEYLILRIIGRLSLPLFAYSAAIGYTRTKNPKKYIIRIFCLAVISQVPYVFVFNNGYFNVLFTISTGLIIIHIINLHYNKIIKAIFSFVLIFICDVLYFEYGLYCIMLMIAFYIYREDYIKMMVAITLATILAIIIYNYQYYQLVAIISLILIYLLRNIDFKIPKSISYTLYPAHLILFILIIRYLY